LGGYRGGVGSHGEGVVVDECGGYYESDNWDVLTINEFTKLFRLNR
jgi:hypothetical protein